MVYNIGDLLRVKLTIFLFFDYSQPAIMLNSEELVVVASKPQQKILENYAHKHAVYRTVVYMLYHGNIYYFSCLDQEEFDRCMPKYFELVQQ